MNKNIELTKNIKVLFGVNLFILVSLFLFRLIFNGLGYYSLLVNIMTIINVVFLLFGIVYNVLMIIKKEQFDNKNSFIIIVVAAIIYLVINTVGICLINKPIENKYKKYSDELYKYCELYECETYEVITKKDKKEYIIENNYLDYNNNLNSIKLNALYDINGMNILEVGGGVYPTLAERIFTKAGKVTVYDPRLSKGEVDTDKLKLVRKDFKKNMSLRDYDLVLALMPCRGAEAVLDACVEQDKDFIVGLCEGGPHGDCFDFYEDEDEWIHSMITYSDTRIRRNGKGKVLTKHLDGCSYPYPIVYNSRK